MVEVGSGNIESEQGHQEIHFGGTLVAVHQRNCQSDCVKLLDTVTQQILDRYTFHRPTIEVANW